MSLFKLRLFSVNILILLSNVLAAQDYFQQKTDYTIYAKLNDKKLSLDCYEEIIYKNNSKDTLYEIWMHLWPNAYRNNNSSLVKQQVEDGNLDLYFAEQSERGYIDSLQWRVDGKIAEFMFKEIDFGKLKLNDPLLPGKSLSITTPFYVKIPNAKFSRLGHDGQAFYISQWYPKPAVYDKYGWHAMPYLDQGEFYSEFGDYNVTIELPKNYVIGATGVLKNSEEYEWMTAKADETKAMTSFPKIMSFPPSDTTFKKLTWTQDNVHDFAWFADKRFHVMKGEVELPHTKKKVTTWSMFTNDKAVWWLNGVKYINQALYYYSLWNGDYLYEHCTAVDGVISAGVGMEYPMITICGGETDSLMLDATIAHEVGHNWFYGMLASNEREHPWMDEGMNSFNEMRYMMTLYPDSVYGNKNELMLAGDRFNRMFKIDNLDYKEAWQLEHNLLARTQKDQPIEGHSTQYDQLNYGATVYRKTGIAFQYLKDYLGDSLFDACMQNYFNNWKLKHPQPEDVAASFRSVSGKSLDWFFDDVINSNKKIDYKISSIKNKNDIYTIGIKNKGEVNGPFKIQGLKGEEVITSVMSEGGLNSGKLNIRCVGCTTFEIDHFHNIPEVNRKNNRIRTSGVFRKAEPLSVHMLPHFESVMHTNINVFPSIGWNNYNKWMAGVTIYDKFIPFKPFEYALTGLYGFGDRGFAGLGSLTYNIYNRTGIFENISITAKAKRFAYFKNDIRVDRFELTKESFHYNRLEQAIEFSVRNKNKRSPLKDNFGFSVIETFVEETEIKDVMILNDSTSYNITGIGNFGYHTFRAFYQHRNTRVLDPYSYRLQFEGNEDYGKLSATVKFRFNYKNSRKGVEGRLFGGTFLYNEDKAPVQYPWSLSAWDGQRDYWFDELYFGRSEFEGIASQQMSLNDGGFKTDVPYARVTTWLTALNIKAALPGSLPIKLFLDIGTFKDAKSHIEIYNDNILYDGGVCVSLAPDVFEVYIPFFFSKGLKNYIDDQDIKFGERIRFIINLNAMNPLNLRNQIIK